MNEQISRIIGRFRPGLFAWACLLAAIAATLAWLQMNRYEYNSIKSVRVDRLTGTVEMFCTEDGNWSEYSQRCSNAVAQQEPARSAVPISSTSREYQRPPGTAPIAEEHTPLPPCSDGRAECMPWERLWKEKSSQLK